LPALFAITGCASTPDDCADAGPGTVCEVAGTGDLAYNGDALPAAQSAFYLPSEARREDKSQRDPRTLARATSHTTIFWRARDEGENCDFSVISEQL
jgi:hypothetical protein